MNPEAADRNIDPGQGTQTPDLTCRKPHFLVRFAQRGLLVAFARFNDASRQGHLPAVPIEGVRPKCQQHVGTAVDWEQQEETGCLADAGCIKSGRPYARRVRRHDGLSCRSRQDALQRRLEPSNDVGELHEQNRERGAVKTASFASSWSSAPGMTMT